MHDVENLVGSTLSSRYQILDKIGTGGMATVYKAHDNVLDRDVAIKLLRNSFEGDKKVVSNFIREAQSSASLVHPNVVSVYDVCEYDGLNFMVMELVNGITLKQYIKEHPRMPWQEACDYAIQIGQGIRAAHERGIIHRDIKPQNIIMAPGGVLKVTDFGIARAVEGDKSIAGGTAMGSVHYISPEQAKGGFTDFRSDIYSLGVVLYEMLAGRVPFDGDSPVSVALMHIEEEPLSVKCVNIDVPADLDYITMKAMSREPGKRYQTITELLDDLRAVLSEENLPSREAEKGKETDGGKAAEEKREDIGDIKSRGRNTRVKEQVRSRLKKKNAERNAAILAISTIAAIILIVMGLLVIFIKPFSKTVPDLTGLTITEAREKAEKSGYKLSDEIEYAVSDSVEEDRVISQLPEAGSAAPRIEPIKLVVSLGASGGNIEVPNVENIKIEEAAAAIEAAGLNYRLVTEYSDEIEQGYVIRQTPEAGTHLNEGDTVTIHYSIGADDGSATSASATVPSVLGMTISEAESAIRAAGLELGSVSNRASSRPEGTVINQSPASGVSVREGTSMSIVISSGSETVTAAPVATPTAKPNTATETPGGSSAAMGGAHMYTIKIPSDIKNDKITVQIVANGVTIHNAIHSKSEGQVTVEIPDSGSVSVQAYIDGAKISDKTVTF